MSNIISFDEKVVPDDDSLAMPNGGTDVFINILAFSGSVIARTESEKRLMVYLSEKYHAHLNLIVEFMMHGIAKVLANSVLMK